MQKINYMIMSLIVLISFSAQAEISPSLISVNGTVEKSLDPNMAVLQIEIFGKAMQAKVAQDLQAKEFLKLKNLVDKFKIRKEDFTSESMNINTEYSYDQKTQQNKVVGYRVVHQLKIVLRKVSDLGPFLDGMTSDSKVDQSGVQLQSMSWDSDQKSQAESALLIEAIKSAQQKAEVMAQAAKVKIKSIYRIEHSSSVVLNSRSGPESMAMKSFAAPSGTEMASGAVKVRADVLMQFEIN